MKTDGHVAFKVTQSAKTINYDCLHVNIHVVGTAGGSNTTALAIKVYKLLGTEQNDYLLHIVSLIVFYSLGLQ